MKYAALVLVLLLSVAVLFQSVMEYCMTYAASSFVLGALVVLYIAWVKERKYKCLQGKQSATFC